MANFTNAQVLAILNSPAGQDLAKSHLGASEGSTDAQITTMKAFWDTVVAHPNATPSQVAHATLRSADLAAVQTGGGWANRKPKEFY